MSTSLGRELPRELWTRLRQPTAGPWADVAIPVASVDRLGRAHPALLSYDEIAAPDPGTLRLALYAGSTTSDNLRLRGTLTLFLIEPGAVHYVKAFAREVEGGLPDHPGLALFEAQIEDVLRDHVDPELEGSAEVVSAVGLRRGRAARGLRACLVPA